MYFDVIIAGFGGQGVMFMGNMLAYAAMEADKHVTYMPVYGVEMRGGTANCTVVISNNPVGSPIIHEPLCAVVLNQPSAERFIPRIHKNGLVIANASLVDKKYVSTDSRIIYYIPSLEIATKVGTPRLANMVMLGALVYLSNVLLIEQVIKILPEVLAPRYYELIPANSIALRLGAEAVS